MLVAKVATTMAFVATIVATKVYLITAVIAVKVFRLTKLIKAFKLKLVKVCHRYPFKSFFGYFIKLPSLISLSSLVQQG